MLGVGFAQSGMGSLDVDVCFFLGGAMLFNGFNREKGVERLTEQQQQPISRLPEFQT